MPWIIKENGGSCGGDKRWAVLNQKTGDLVGCHATKEKARAQQKLLYAKEPSAAQAAWDQGAISYQGYRQMKRLGGSMATASHSNLSDMSTLDNGTATTTVQVPSVWYQWSGSSGNVPLQITISPAENVDPQNSGAWESVLAVEGSPSSDKRYLIPTEIGERDLPLPLRMVTADHGGHDGAVQVGRIESIQHIPIGEFAKADEYNLGDLPDSAIVIWGEGVFDGDPEMVETAQTMIRNGAGISLDLPHDRLALIDPETLEEVPEDEVDLMDVLSNKYLTGIGGKIAAATIVDIPAFEEATISLSDGEAVVASSYGIKLLAALVASVGRAPLAPPKAWFEVPEAEGPTPLTITDEGQVFGHLATWNQCHASFPGSCELAPKSRSKYKYFHLGSLETAEGDQIQVGRITVGKGNSLSGGHYWDLYGGSKGAIDHYDKTGTVGAFVRAKDGKHGIWVSGATRSDAPPETIRDMRANPPSGDWRWENGGLELVAALSVPVPAYPVPYLMASSGDHPLSLIATGYSEEEKKAATRSDMRKMTSLMSQAREELATGLCPDCGSMNTLGHDCSGETEDNGMAAKKKAKGMGGGVVITPGYADEPWMSIDHVEALVGDGVEFAYNAAQRKKAVESGAALPDGSFPILNCGDAENAIHAQGRAQNQDQAVAHIKKRVKALGCTGSIFDNYK